MTDRAWVTLRQHRFEVAFSVVAALSAAALAFITAAQIDGLGVSEECIAAARAAEDAGAIDEDCFALIQAGSSILGETLMGGAGTLQLSIMAVLPFMVGLLGGLPIVARELEERTAQTAWWLNASRTRWLTQQLLPIGLLLAAALGIAAVAAIPVGEDWVRWGNGGASELIGQHGPVLLTRGFAAFGIGLAVGALLGRALPGFVLSLAMVLAVLFMVGQARETWMSGLPLEPLATQSAETGEWVVVPGGQVRSFGFMSPDREFLTANAARQRAREGGAALPDPNDEQDTPAAIWLQENGYVEVPLGVSDDLAMGWTPIEGGIFVVVGVIGLAGAFVVVNRQRPS